MPCRSLSVIALLCCTLAAACGATSQAPAAASASGADAPGAPPPPPSADQAPPAAVPATHTDTAKDAAVVPVADPVAVSPEIYKVVLDSPHMRILEGTWKPKQKDKPHGHPPLVAYALTDFRGLGHGDAGKPVTIDVKAGQAFFQNAVHSHVFENVGKKPARALMVELKQGTGAMPLPDGAATDALAASPDVYKRVFEDAHVRVLYAEWEGGHMDENHSHPGLAVYFLTDAEGKLHEGFGQTIDIDRKAGQALFEDPVRSHAFENGTKKPIKMVLFEPKAIAFGASGAGAGAHGEAVDVPVEEGDGEVTSFVDVKTGVRMDIGGGFTLDVPPGVRFFNVVTLNKTRERPSNKLVAEGFSRHAATLNFDGLENKLAKPVVMGIGIKRMPERAGQKFVLAMEYSGECTKQNRKHELEDGGCSNWKIIPTEFDEQRKKVVAKLTETGGYRLQFGWMPDK